MEQNQTEGKPGYPKIVYHPIYQETQLVRFRKCIESKHNVDLSDYWDFHEWTCKNFPEFWECVWEFFNIKCSVPYTEVYDKRNGFESMEWFKGVKMNFAENILKYRDDRTALIAADDYDNVEYISYKQLYDEVNIYVDALKASGINKGDIVACYMSNKKEAIFAFLAVACIGAIFSGALPLLGAKAVLVRFSQIKPKILFTGGNFYFQNHEIKMIEKIPEIVSGIPSLKKVVFVPSKPTEELKAMPESIECVYISEYLKEFRDKLRQKHQDIMFEQLSFDYPLHILFTSGTTGDPKGNIHPTGMFLASLKDYGLHQSITRDDVVLNFSPGGWISWNMFLNCLHLGTTLVVYEGIPFDHSPTRFYDLVDRFGITSAYIWSSTVEEMERDGAIPTSKHSLKTLRQLFPMGSPAKPQSYDFLTEKVKKNLFCSPVYGTTEVFGMICGLDSNMPVYKGEMHALSLGMDVKILNEKGEPVMGQRGELVLANPYPGLPVCMLNDEDKVMFRDVYLKQYPGYWNVGDDAWRNPLTKGLIVYGRSDETLNPKGARFSCSEIYFALEGFPGLIDSVCTSQYNDKMDERVILFVKMAPGHRLNQEVVKKLQHTIEHHLTIEHVPEIIMEVPDIPYNLTGKKLNGLVKKLVNKKNVQNLSVVVNPSSVDFFKNLNLGPF